jgi:hypothetical protein
VRAQTASLAESRHARTLRVDGISAGVLVFENHSRKRPLEGFGQVGQIRQVPNPIYNVTRVYRDVLYVYAPVYIEVGKVPLLPIAPILNFEPLLA